jgi:predicted nucleic acid-binding protein
MIILDTNVLSAMVQPRPDEDVVAWLDTQARSSMWITSVTIFEIQFGLQILPVGKKRSLLTKAFESVLTDDIGGRVAPFDTTAAEHSAELMASRHKKGRPVELRDTMIAGIALARHATVATRNVSHFEDLSVPVVNPWVLRS